MGNVIGSTEQMIDKINEVLKYKKNAVVNIVNDKLTLSVFALLERNLKNVSVYVGIYGTHNFPAINAPDQKRAVKTIAVYIFLLFKSKYTKLF